MLPFLTLLACGLGSNDSVAVRPAVVPDDAVAIVLTPEGVTVDGVLVAPREAFEENLTDGIHSPLRDALPAGRENAWIHAPADTPWMLVRKLVVTADDANLSARWVGSGTSAYGPSTKPDANYRPSCTEGRVDIEGVARRLSVEIFSGTDGLWVETAVRFAPLVEGHAALGLPQHCWTGATCDTVGTHAAVCEAAKGSELAPERVPVAGPVGCILPIRKVEGQEDEWGPELASNLKGLGITAADEATLLIEANVPWSAVVGILDGFDKAGLPAPALGLPLVEGHGRPPLCTITVRDAATLETAGAKWLGSRVSSPTPPHPAPE